MQKVPSVSQVLPSLILRPFSFSFHRALLTVQERRPTSEHAVLLQQLVLLDVNMPENREAEVCLSSLGQQGLSGCE